MTALNVDGRAIRVGQIQSVQRKGLFLIAVQLERPISSCSGQCVHDIFVAGIDYRHMVSVHGHVEVLIGACH